MAYFKKLGPMPKYRDLPEHPNNSDHVPRRLINAAWNALHDRDANDISLRELAPEVGVSQPAAYNHFKNRTDLFATVASHALLTLCSELADLGGSERVLVKGLIPKICKVWLRFAVRRPRHYALMYSPAFNDPKVNSSVVFNRKQLQHLFNAVAELELGFRVKGADSDLAFAVLQGAAALVVAGHPPTPPQHVARMIRACLKTITR